MTEQVWCIRLRVPKLRTTRFDCWGVKEVDGLAEAHLWRPGVLARDGDTLANLRAVDAQGRFWYVPQAICDGVVYAGIAYTYLKSSGPFWMENQQAEVCEPDCVVEAKR